MTTEKRNDEIDLIEVFQKMGNGIKNLFNSFFNLLYSILLFFIRKSILILILILLGLAFGYFKYKSSPRYYSSSLEANSNAISSIDMINYVNNIHELFKKGNKLGLQSKLNINLTELEKIKNIKAFKVVDFNDDKVTDLIDYNEKYSTSDSIVSATRFVVKVEVYDPQIFPVIQESFIEYINKNKYINELNIIRKKQLEELITKLSEEITSLDSLKKVEYFTSDGNFKPQTGQLLVMNEKETQLYHEQIINLFRQKQSMERALELNTEPITVIQDFSSLSTVENNLITYFKFYGLAGLIFGILISIIIENFKGILKIIRESKIKS
ncbi:MAG: hypothetical protein KAQ75_09995 [Bacteroidales bacterium]|nr:hypothetical protein [Bacteroidales bacterium]